MPRHPFEWRETSVAFDVLRQQQPYKRLRMFLQREKCFEVSNFRLAFWSQSRNRIANSVLRIVGIRLRYGNDKARPWHPD